jgi:hypothetical protein
MPARPAVDVVARANALIERDAVEPIPAARAYRVSGDNGRDYLVVVHGQPAVAECPCHAGEHGVTCKHGLAALYIDRRITEAVV